jgi:hypothetical protein
MTLATDHRLSVTALCLMIAAAGWYYLFYSRAAHRLGAIEAADANRWRVLLRRCNGLLMMALAALVYIAAASQIPEKSPSLAEGLLLGIVILLGVCVLLAWIDIRMTMNLRNRRRGDKNDDEHS